MKQRSLLILSFIALLFASCGNKGGKSGLMVPKDAAVVIHINSKSLSSKLSWNEIKQTNWFKILHREAESTDTLAQKLMNDPSSSGVDTKADFIMYVKKHGQGSYMVVEGSLTNQATYEQTLAEIHKKKPKEIKKHGDFSYIESGEGSVVLWNKTNFAMVSNAHIPNVNMGPIGKRRIENFEFESDSLRIFGEQSLTLEGGDNLDSDSRFADLIKDGSDVHIWTNAGSFLLGMIDPLIAAKAKPILEGNVSAMSLNFDNGKITAKLNYYYNDQLSKIHADNKPANISADVINRIPSSDVIAVMAFNYSPDALKEVLKLTEMDIWADMYLSKMNFSVDDFLKANKGEVLFAVTDPKAKMNTMKIGDETHSYPSMPNANILFATSVKDKASFEKMVALLSDVAKKQFGISSDDAGKPGISYKLDNNWFVISNSPEYTDKFLAGGKNKFSFTDKITGHPMGMYIDLQRIIKFAGSMMGDDSSAKAAVDLSLNMWQDITAKGGDYKDKSVEAEFEINLVDKNTNSLKQLNQYIDKLSMLRNERRTKMKEAIIGDMKDEKPMAPPAPKD